MTQLASDSGLDGNSFPEWVPKNVHHYLSHTDQGVAIRDLARRCGCHASTILRQIRRVENLRDDPVVDHTLTVLGKPDACQDTTTILAESRRVLRRLCETGAVLAVADEMDTAVVVRDGDGNGGGSGMKTAAVDRLIVGVLVLNDWVSGTRRGRIRRYTITSAGRTNLNKLLAHDENAKRAEMDAGFGEAPSRFDGPTKHPLEIDTGDKRRMRYGIVESPLVALSRRRDKNGRPFLTDDLVRAGERLREDFDLAQVEPGMAQDWVSFLTAGVNKSSGKTAATDGPRAAQDRVQAALDDLGPGLRDVALRCCCFLEGLEATEKHMGWSARSGKIVLRIALQRLNRHYESPNAQAQLFG